MIIKFYAYDFANDNIGYHAIGPNENVSGEYVPLAEYEEFKNHMESLVKESYELKGLIRRVLDSNVYDRQSLHGVVYKSPDLEQLLKDCQEAL